MSSAVCVVMCAMVLWTGCWQGVQSCNTQREKCNELMDLALEMERAEQRCDGMIKYVACVEDDIADCPDNTYNAQYALNMKSLHCSPAYICSQKLQGCYANFSNGMRRSIQQSDLSTRTQLCRDLMKDIMTCQEEVTSECQGQTGLMETVKTYQASLNVVCNNTDPCVTMVLQCQKSIVDIGAAAAADQPPPALSDCAAQKPIDYCGAYRQAASCIRSGLSTCNGHLTVDNTLASLDNTTNELCDPENTCRQKMSACLCHINKQSLESPVAIMTTICNTYDPFARCLDGLGEECGDSEGVQREVEQLKATYGKHHMRYCTTDWGLCPPALQCLLKLPRQVLSSPSPSSARRTSPFHLNTLCSGADSVFGCLETASTQCQSEASDVTFNVIEDNFQDMCSDLEPQAEKLESCSSFSQCLDQFHYAELGLSPDDPQGHSEDFIRRMFADLTRTEFWCKYLTHSFQCIASTGEECALDDLLIALSIQRSRSLQEACQGPVTPAPTTRAPKTPKDGKSSDGGNGNHGNSVLHSSSHHRWWLIIAVIVVTVISRSLPALH